MLTFTGGWWITKWITPANKSHVCHDGLPKGRGDSAALAWFLVLTFALSWAIWVPEGLAELHLVGRHIPRSLYMLAQMGPALAAIVVSVRMRGRGAVKALLASVIRMRQSPWWYVLVVALPPVTLVLTAAVYRALVGPVQGSPTWSDSPVLIVLGTPLSLGEEIGWRGFLLPTFLRRQSPLVATACVAFWWGLWHAPAYLPQSGGLAFYLVFLAGVFPVAAFLTWIFLRTRSVLLCALFHASIDAAANCYSWLFSPQHLLFVGTWIVVLSVAAIPVLLAIRKSSEGAKAP